MRSVRLLVPVVAGVVVVGIAVVLLINQKSRADANRAANPGITTSLDIGVGDCLRHLDDEPFEYVNMVSCDDSHVAEVYHAVEIARFDRTSTDVLILEVETECLERFETFVGIPQDQSIYGLAVLAPLDVQRTGGDLWCVATGPGGTATTGSAQGAAR